MSTPTGSNTHKRQRTPETSTPAPSLTRKKTKTSFSRSSLVTILVGKGAKQQEFVVHESFLANRSEFFRAALSGDRWTETETREIKFPEDKPHVFALYLEYIYTGKMGTIHTELDDASSMNKSTFMKVLDAEYKDLFQFYFLAEKLLDVAAKNTSIHALFAKLDLKHSNKRYHPGTDHLAAVYEGTPVGSPCRRILIDIVSQFPATLLEEDLKDYMDIIPKEAWVDLSVALARRSSDPIEKGVAAYLEGSGDGTDTSPSKKRFVAAVLFRK